jgi:hypothetical protein
MKGPIRMLGGVAIMAVGISAMVVSPSAGILCGMFGIVIFIEGLGDYNGRF